MSNVFNDFEFDWKGETYQLPGNRVLGAIAAIEEVLTLVELRRYIDRKTLPFAKLSQAYAALLNHMGVAVTPEEVYRGMFGDNPSASGAGAEACATAIIVLGNLMVPPEKVAARLGNQSRPQKGARAAKKK